MVTQVYFVKVNGGENNKLIIPTPEFLPREGDYVTVPDSKEMSDCIYKVVKVVQFIYQDAQITHICIYVKPKQQ